MGSGSWDNSVYCSYTASKNLRYDSYTGDLVGNYNDKQLFKEMRLHADLDLKGKIRECCDTPEHPNSFPVILALDVTGSMGDAAVQIASKLGSIISNCFAQMKDVEFMTMGIGDLAYDNYPIQGTQFESDVRISEQLDKIYIEHGGGGNGYESYSEAWYYGLFRTKLDCYDKHGKKGLIITMGDETLNPYLPDKLCDMLYATGDVEGLELLSNTESLYREASKKFHIVHLVINHRRYHRYTENSPEYVSFAKVIGEENTELINVEELSDSIVNIIKKFYDENQNEAGRIVGVDLTPEPAADNIADGLKRNENGEITW